jgi:hypothetical protein
MQAEKKQFQVQLFQGVEHGFALRGDINNPYERTSLNTHRVAHANGRN